jgi:hypothetical protein
MHACAQHIDRGSVSRCRCARPLACARLLLSSGFRAALLARAGVQSVVLRHAREGSAGGGHPRDPGGVRVRQQSWADRRRGVDAAGSERGESSTHPVLRLLIIRASIHQHKPPSTCTLGVWAVACACVCEGVYARACAGRASERCGLRRVWGKQTVPPSPGTLGECLCVFARARARACVRMCVNMRICVCGYLY